MDSFSSLANFTVVQLVVIVLSFLNMYSSSLVTWIVAVSTIKFYLAAVSTIKFLKTG